MGIYPSDTLPRRQLISHIEILFSTAWLINEPGFFVNYSDQSDKRLKSPYGQDLFLDV